MTKYFKGFLTQTNHESTTHYLQIYFGKDSQIPTFLDINYKHRYISKTYLVLQEQLLAAIFLYCGS